jgi:Zn-dependent protease
VNPLNVTLAATVGLLLAAGAAQTATRWDRCPRWVVSTLCYLAGIGAVVAVLLAICGIPFDTGSVRRTFDGLMPSARTLYAAGFYAGCLVLAGLVMAILTAPWWLDREADDPFGVSRKKDGPRT